MQGADAVDRYANELLAAVSAAIARDAKVAACRERAKACGFDLRVALQAQAVPLNGVPANSGPLVAASSSASVVAVRGEITDADRRFLRALRIKV